MTHGHHDTVCIELVERLTDLLEDAVDTEERVRLEQHLVFCEGCAAYVEQMQETAGLVGRVEEPAEVEPDRASAAALAAELLRRAAPGGGAG